MSERLSNIKSMLAEDPGDIFLNYALGLELRAIGETQKACDQFRRTIELKQDHIPSWHQLAIEERGRGRSDEAYRATEHGLAHAEQQNDNQAIKELKELIATIRS